jgi:phosphoglycolate phosphatase-like HAD superfamily hydrolase
MRVLVMDFDGVISDSVPESFEIALGAYLDLRPGSRFSGIGGRDRERLYEGFVDRMPLGNRAEDYGTILTALESRTPTEDQRAYDLFRAGQDPAWLEDYQQRFYEERAAKAESDPDGWLSMMRPYPRFVDILRRRATDAIYAVATAKDGTSVRILLRRYGLAELIPDSLVMDKETGVAKSAHLTRLQERLEVPWGAMTFIDDKVTHLDSVAPLGVRCALAAWGYNGPREHRLAAERGYLVCALDQAERKLLGD